MNDPNLIIVVRALRKHITALDSIGVHLKDVTDDPDLSKMLDSDILQLVGDTSNKLHQFLLDVEKTQQYKNIVRLSTGE